MPVAPMTREEAERASGPGCDLDSFGQLHGWFNAAYTDAAGTEVHGLPVADIRSHLMDEECWCEPVLLDQTSIGRAWSHNSADGRERAEQGHRQ